MIKGKTSIHIQQERMERMVFIATTVGFGNEVCRFHNYRNNTWKCLTDTGCIIVRACDDEDFIVTAFICSLGAGVHCCAMAGIEMPRALKHRILRNEKMGYQTRQNK